MDQKVWAVLKREKDTISILINKNKFTIGRSKDCDLSYPDNKMLSSNHCYIEKDNNGRIWLVDTSRNGILINMNKKVNNEKQEIFYDDKIALVYRANEPEKTIEFSFEEIKEEEKEPVAKKQKLDETKSELTSTTACASNNVADNDDIADTLTCSICAEIMHDCVSLQPCMHTYCAGCYSEWMEKSKQCPQCRLDVDRICKNHIVNNLIEAYVKANPKRKRSDESIAELEAKNKITHDMLYPKEKKKSKKRFEYDEEYEYSDDEDGEEYGEEEEEEEEEEEPYAPQPPFIPFANQPNLFGGFAGGFHAAVNPFQPFAFGGLAAAAANPNQLRCRQCPVNKYNYQADAKYPDYTCTLVQNHLLCQCCMEAMPDRAAEIAINPHYPRQTCSVCFKAYCHLYWGCKKDGCKGCLNKYQDHVFNDATFLNTILNENQYESKILIDYLNKQNKTVQGLFNECIRKMRNGVFRSTVINQQFPNEKVVCRHCALKTFQDYAYVYRTEIPSDELPGEVKNRTDCRWGKNCRTQKHNQVHARNYNHICDQQN